MHQQEQEHTQQHKYHIEPMSREPTREVTPKEKPICKAKVSGLKASDKDSSVHSLHQSLHLILQNLLAGRITNKLNLFSNIVYGKGKDKVWYLRRQTPVSRREDER